MTFKGEAFKTETSIEEHHEIRQEDGEEVTISVIKTAKREKDEKEKITIEKRTSRKSLKTGKTRVTSLLETKKKSPVPELPLFSFLTKSVEESDSEEDTVIPMDPGQDKKPDVTPKSSALTGIASSFMSLFSSSKNPSQPQQPATTTTTTVASELDPSDLATTQTTTTTTTTLPISKSSTGATTTTTTSNVRRATSSSSSTPATPTTPLTPRSLLTESSGSNSALGPAAVALRHLRKFQHFTVKLDEVQERDKGDGGN
jgi:hypothetical protein